MRSYLGGRAGCLYKQTAGSVEHVIDGCEVALVISRISLYGHRDAVAAQYTMCASRLDISFGNF
jgi:hypothetical protein